MEITLLSKHKCVECGEESNEFMPVVSRLKIDDDNRETTEKELWCFSCFFRRSMYEYNEMQKELHAVNRDTRFMTESDKKTYGFRPPMRIPEK